MIVVDTSVWVAALRSRSSREATVLGQLLDADEVALPVPVRVEILSGASKADRHKLRRVLSALPSLYPTDDTWRLIDGWLDGAGFGSEREPDRLHRQVNPKAIELIAPGTASAALPATFQPQELIINVDAGGRYFVDGAFREIGEVRARIVTAHTNNPLTQSVIIRADRNASWQAVAEVMGICREAGIEQYSATMESAEGGE